MYWRRMDKTIPRGPARSLETGAETLRSFGDPNSARLWDIAAVELERAQALFAGETFPLREAARESGYTPDYLGSLVKRGKIPNAGRTNAARIRRQDLPLASHPDVGFKSPRAKSLTRL